uniref:Uncharacterized protein n=1 Tax=Tanacetum cinerariifolium TaxID=118510 RepID=A0A6L2LVK7_TANCI|nr:hypothetical protein [Tanacetum cinerariifolium]
MEAEPCAKSIVDRKRFTPIILPFLMPNTGNELIFSGHKLLGLRSPNSLRNPTPHENQWKNHRQCLICWSIKFTKRRLLQRK